MATTAPTTHPAHRSVWPRWVNAALGIWLMVSAFLMAHTAASRVNTALVGALVIAGAAWGTRHPAGRLTSTVLATWLVISSLVFLMPAGPAAIWSNLFAAALIFFVSLVPGGGDELIVDDRVHAGGRRARPRTPHANSWT